MDGKKITSSILIAMFILAAVVVPVNLMPSAAAAAVGILTVTGQNNPTSGIYCNDPITVQLVIPDHVDTQTWKINWTRTTPAYTKTIHTFTFTPLNNVQSMTLYIPYNVSGTYKIYAEKVAGTRSAEVSVTLKRNLTIHNLGGFDPTNDTVTFGPKTSPTAQTVYLKGTGFKENGKVLGTTGTNITFKDAGSVTLHTTADINATGVFEKVVTIANFSSEGVKEVMIKDGTDTTGTKFSGVYKVDSTGPSITDVKWCWDGAQTKTSSPIYANNSKWINISATITDGVSGCGLNYTNDATAKNKINATLVIHNNSYDGWYIGSPVSVTRNASGSETIWYWNFTNPATSFSKEARYYINISAKDLLLNTKWSNTSAWAITIDNKDPALDSGGITTDDANNIYLSNKILYVNANQPINISANMTETWLNSIKVYINTTAEVNKDIITSWVNTTNNTLPLVGARSPSKWYSLYSSFLSKGIKDANYYVELRAEDLASNITWMNYTDGSTISYLYPDSLTPVTPSASWTATISGGTITSETQTVTYTQTGITDAGSALDESKIQVKLGDFVINETTGGATVTNGFTPTYKYDDMTFDVGVYAVDKVNNSIYTKRTTLTVNCNNPTGVTIADITSPAVGDTVSRTEGTLALRGKTLGDTPLTFTYYLFNETDYDPALTIDDNIGAGTYWDLGGYTGWIQKTSQDTTHTFDLPDLVSGTIYLAVLEVMDNDRYALYDLTTFSTLGVPARVASLTATTVSNGIKLDWTAPSGTVTGYKVYRNGAEITTSTTRPTATTYTDTTAVSGTTYTYTVAAYNTVGTGTQSAPVSTSWTTTADTTAPAAITTLAVVSGGVTTNSAQLQWTAPGDDGATGTVSGYTVKYSTSTITAANWASATTATVTYDPTTLVAAGTLQKATVTGLNAETKYYFAVKAKDEVPNEGNMSNVVNATTGADSTAPAGTFTVTSSTHVANTPTSNNDPVFSWTGVTDAESTVTYYYALVATGTYAITTADANTTAATITLTDKADGTWYFHIAGKSAGGWTATNANYKIIIDTVAPDQPTGVEAKWTKDGIKITWDAVTGAAGYQVWRSSSPFTLLYTVTSGATTSYVDDSGVEGTDYGYKVTSFDAAGNGKFTGAVGSEPDATFTTTTGFDSLGASDDVTFEDLSKAWYAEYWWIWLIIGVILLGAAGALVYLFVLRGRKYEDEWDENWSDDESAVARTSKYGEGDKVAEGHAKIRCPECGEVFVVEDRERPATFNCPGCGKKGILH